MPKYRFRVQDIDGKVVDGLVEAATEDTAADILTDKGYTILILSERSEESLVNRAVNLFNRVKAKDLMLFSREFSVLISATVPIVQALNIMVRQLDHPYLQRIVGDLADRVSGGIRLSDALARHPKVFSDFYINMVRSGEHSGKLDEILEYLADQLEHDYELMSKIRGALIYPAFILSGFVGVAIFMMVKVIPQLLDVIEESGSTLPFATRLLISSSNFFVSFWWLLVFLIIGLGFGFRFYIATNAGERQWHFVKLYIPIFGKLFRKIYIVRFTRSLGTLIKGGVNIMSALEITAATVGNVIFRDIMLETSKEVENGNSISTVLVKSSIVPPMVSQIMLVGEETGRLDDVMEKITNFYSLEVDNTVRNLVSLLEPLIIMTMGAGVGLLVAAIILPIYQVATSF